MNREPSHTDIYGRLGSIEAKIDFLVAGAQDREHRLQKVEQFQSKVLGMAAGVSGVISVIFKYLSGGN